MINFKIEDNALNFKVSEDSFDFKTDAEYIASGTSFETPYAFDYALGYVATGAWAYQNSQNNASDFYTIKSGHTYTLELGSQVGTRFRAIILAIDPYGYQGSINGTMVINTNNPAARSFVTFIPSIDGYLAVQKDNAGTKGLLSYLIDVTPEE